MKSIVLLLLLSTVTFMLASNVIADEEMTKEEIMKTLLAYEKMADEEVMEEELALADDEEEEIIDGDMSEVESPLGL